MAGAFMAGDTSLTEGFAFAFSGTLGFALAADAGLSPPAEAPRAFGAGLGELNFANSEDREVVGLLRRGPFGLFLASMREGNEEAARDVAPPEAFFPPSSDSSSPTRFSHSSRTAASLELMPPP